MSVPSEQPFRAAVGKPKPPVNVKNQRWYSFFKSLIVPVVVLILFAAAPYWLNNQVRAGITKAIDADSRLSPDERNERLAQFSHINFASVCRGSSPEFANLRAALIKASVADTYDHLRLALICSVLLVGLVLIVSAILFTFNNAAKNSPADLIRYYRLGWRLAMVSAFIQILLLVPLLTYAAYEFPVLWFNSWSPKLVIVVPLIGVLALWRSLSILVKKVPLQFNELMSRRVTPEEAPELWQAVRIAASRLDTAPPDNIIIGLQLNFYVTELAVWDGKELAKGRTLYLSYPLLKQLPEEEVIAVIGHELGHFIGEDTRMTREFYPMRLKARATVVSLAHATYVGWTSLQFMNFFGWCFGETEQAMSRKRELLADKKAVALTSPEAAARALVRFHVLIEAFQQGLVDAVRKGAQSPLDVSLHTVVREKLPAGATFWTELFEKKLPHPLDSHPALHVRLEALGQSMDTQTAQALTTQENESAYTRWFASRDALFAELRQQADAVMQKMRSKARVLDADYSTAEGRALLDSHFPTKQWRLGQGTFWFALVLVVCAAIGCWVTAVLAPLEDLLAVRLLLLAGGLWAVYGAVITWTRHRNAVFTLNADGVNYTGWKRPLRFKEVEHLHGQRNQSKVTLTFRLKEPQPPIWKCSLLGSARKRVRFSLSGLKGAKPVNVAQDIFRYYTRHIPD